MNTVTTPNNDHWLYLWDKLHNTRFQPLPTQREVNEVLKNLPEHQTITDFAQCMTRVQNARVANVIPFKQFRFTKLTELRLKAAKGGDHKLPIPETSRVTPNGAFRFTLTKTTEGLNIHIKTLAMATEKYQNCYIGIAASDDKASLLLVIKLDKNGEGNTVIADCEEARQVLCVNPVFALIEPENA